MCLRGCSGVSRPARLLCMIVLPSWSVFQNDDRLEQIQAGETEMLAFGASVSDFALTVDSQGVLQRMVRFAELYWNLGDAA